MVSLIQLDLEVRQNLKELMKQIDLDRKSKEEREKLLPKTTLELQKDLLKKILKNKVEMEKYLQKQRLNKTESLSEVKTNPIEKFKRRLEIEKNIMKVAGELND